MAVITISRQFGSEGLAVARRAAELLGYKWLDRAIVTEVARLADVSEWEVERHDERGQGLFEKLLTSVFGNPSTCSIGALGGGYGEIMIEPALLEQSRIPDREDILSLVRQVIQAAARRGDVVIVGRASQALLADWPETLHVRLVAPLEFRIQRVAEQEGVSPEEAMALIQKTDQNRERYIRQRYGVDWEDINLYHMILNVERTGVALAADLIAGAAARLSKVVLRRNFTNPPERKRERRWSYAQR